MEKPTEQQSDKRGADSCAAPCSAFVRHLQSAWEHLHAAEKLYPAGCDAFTVSGHVERAKHDCKQAARLVGGLPNEKSSESAGRKKTL